MHTFFLFAFLSCLGTQQAQSDRTPCPASSQRQVEAQGVTQPEREALIALYKATDGDHWKNHSGWLGPEGTECTWYGVTCDPSYKEPTTVMWLDLFENNLVGSIPEAIGQLNHLRWLDLFNNHISGPIPDSMGRLTQLEWLTIHGNNFSSRLPDPLLQRWLNGPLDIRAEIPIFTDISKIDFQWVASGIMCARTRSILRSDKSVVTYTERCRNATPTDERTYCEVKKGKLWPIAFAKLGLLIEKNGFFNLPAEYSRTVTHAAFEDTRVNRNGKAYAVSNYADAGPLELWTIQRAIEGVASSSEWDKTATRPECPSWKLDQE